ncbi:MAG: (2Fe-2S) ferredoxin domain-containing protein [Candidatus Omnitrophica bacterium]|nr:(2Fe-2S) ferredoxin domain-containing protein [Candidatus Omnitrophota bacterium]
MEAKRSPYLKHLYVCVNRRDPPEASCAPGGSEGVREKLKSYVKENGLKGKVRVSSSGCMDLCARGPNVMVYPDHLWYSNVALADVDRIIEEHLAPLVTESAK